MVRWTRMVTQVAGWLLLIGWAVATAGAGETAVGEWLAVLDTEQDKLPDPRVLAGPAEWTKPIPISFSVDYTLVTDYIFRGINFSEYADENRERLNHQLGVGAEFETESVGVFGIAVWFEWYAGQQQLTPSSNSHLQEVDYSAYWRYEVEALATTVELGWIAYVFPILEGDARYTHEWYVALALDDGKVLGLDAPILNPTVTMYHDLDDFKGRWIEVAISHDFPLSDCQALRDVVIAKDITITPSMTLGIDNRWLANAVAKGNSSTKLANLLYGLDVSFDVSSALNIPEQYGTITVTGFLYFSQALRDALLNDEFYGGVSVGYAW
ncbi:hypothetical protein LCGC14_0512840 [marine sediment metagenome]|uniref:Uncharacterized protein n=1 Tax=marine sediment metagenome TaxID=412755 RepID=A0A0F9UMA0_9ZZZZ|nr:hypothetical protein [Phycisphaerae bacterium]HDZ43833.1 hypothetical protein [Phycisphaerae bacterium]